MIKTQSMLAGYFRDLFTFDAGDGSLTYLPFLVTAVAVGVLLAAGCFTIVRAQESKLLKRLLSADAIGRGNAKSLTDLGYRPGTLEAKLTLRALRSPACALYRNTSSAELDALKERFSGEGSAFGEAPREQAETMTDEEREGKPDEKTAARKARAEAKRRRNMGLRLAVNQETALYIPEEKRAYVEEHAAKFSPDDWMGLVYTACGVLIVWFLVLNLLKPLAAWLLA